jgi:cell division protein FtsL
LFFVGVPVVYAVTVYLVLEGAQTRGERVEVLILVVALSVAVGVVVWRFATRLEAARAQAERGREELALVMRDLAAQIAAAAPVTH